MSCQGSSVWGPVCVARPCGQLVRQMLLVSKGCLGAMQEALGVWSCHKRLIADSGEHVRRVIGQESKKEELVLHLCPKLVIWASLDNVSY